MTLLNVADLHVANPGPVPAVRGVSLDLAPGQRLGLAGESGSGKSTLALALLRLLPKGSTVTGRAELNGEDVLTMPWGRLRAVRWAEGAIVFQGAMHALNPVRRVGDQIAEPLLLHRTVPTRAAARARVSRLLTDVGLPPARSRAYPHELSGGQRQRAMIAMALACSPALLIADEPTTALDVMIQAQILALLGQLVEQRGIGLLLISHDLSVLAQHCDEVAVMYAGRIVEQARAAELFTEPRHPYTAALTAAFPHIGDPASRRRPQGIPGDPPDPTALPTGCPFQPRCPLARAHCATEEPPLDGGVACFVNNSQLRSPRGRGTPTSGGSATGRAQSPTDPYNLDPA